MIKGIYSQKLKQAIYHIKVLQLFPVCRIFFSLQSVQGGQFIYNNSLRHTDPFTKQRKLPANTEREKNIFLGVKTTYLCAQFVCQKPYVRSQNYSQNCRRATGDLILTVQPNDDRPSPANSTDTYSHSISHGKSHFQSYRQQKKLCVPQIYIPFKIQNVHLTGTILFKCLGN